MSIRSRIFLCLLALLVVVYLFHAACLNKHSTLPVTSIIWEGYDGLKVQRNGTARVETFPLYAKDRTVIRLPVFALWKDRLIYWSRDDRAICMISETGTTSWIQIPNKILVNAGITDDLFRMGNFSVRSIEALPDGVALNFGILGDNGYVFLGVVRINLDTASVTVINNIHQLVTSEPSPQYAVITKQDTVEIWSQDVKESRTILGQVSNYWLDYSPSFDVFTLTDGLHLVVFNHTTKWGKTQLVPC